MKYIRINPVDNVAVALQDLSRGEVVEGVSLRSDVLLLPNARSRVIAAPTGRWVSGTRFG